MNTVIVIEKDYRTLFDKEECGSMQLYFIVGVTLTNDHFADLTPLHEAPYKAN